MSEKVYVEGPNGLVIGHAADVAAGLLRHPDHKKVDGPKAGPSDEELAAAAIAAAGVAEAERAAAEAAALALAKSDEDKAPAGNASLEVWHAYALANGKTSADLDGLKQGEIRALFSE
jgi:hypothetical protein